MESRSIPLSDGRTLEAWIDPDESGTAFVMSYGSPSSGMPYRGQVAAARERGLRWVSWSRPGYGASTRQEGRLVANVAADAREVLDRLGGDKAYVGGWSGGGPHALACAALMPDRVVGAFTIACGAPVDGEGLDFFAGMSQGNVEGFRVAMEGPEADAADMEQAWPFMRNIQPGGGADGPMAEMFSPVDRAANVGEFAKWTAAAIRDGLRDSYLGWLDDDMAAVRPWGFPLDTFETTVHIWHGDQDRFVPFGHGEWLATHVRGACAHLLTGEGHLSMTANRFGEILDEMLKPK